MKKSELNPNPILARPRVPVVCDKCRAEGMASDPMFMGIPEILNFEPVPRRAHVNGWSAEHQRAFIAAVAITGSAKKAAATIGRHAFGAEQLRKARGGRGFSEAWDAALDIARERELARMYENLADLKTSDEAAHARGSGGQEFEGIDLATEEELTDVQASLREKMLSARRLLLAEVSCDMDKRAAWEVLVGPVDWEKAQKWQPQDNEPYGVPNMRGADMVMTAEAGFMAEMVGGRDKKKEMWDAIDEILAGDTDGPAMRRLLA